MPAECVGGYENGAAARVVGEGRGHDALDHKRVAVEFEVLAESWRRFVDLNERVARGTAQQTHVCRCGFDRSGVGSVHRLDRREFPLGATESLGNLVKLHAYRIEVFVAVRILAATDARQERQLESRTNATRIALNVFGPHQTLFAPDTRAPRWAGVFIPLVFPTRLGLKELRDTADSRSEVRVSLDPREPHAG
jgi:hypothetical protein